MRWLSFAAILFYCTSGEAATLTIGRVHENPSRAYKEVKPIVDYAASRLKDLGLTEGSVVVAKDREEMIKFIAEGKVDWTTDSIVSGLLYTQKTGAEILLRRWAGGVPTYYSVMFTRNDSKINFLKDLQGKKIAFQNPGSTTAYYIPVATLRKAGLELVEIPSPRAQAPTGKVGYAFAGDELSITTWVHRGLADAGAYHNQNWGSADTNPEGMKKDLKIFYQSRPFPRMVELVRKDLDANIKSRLKEILLKAHQDPAAQAALKSYRDTAKFDELSGEAKEEMDEARDLVKYLLGKEIR